MTFNQDELDELLARANYHLEEHGACVQAAYHVMCERGEGNSVSIALEMSALLSKVKEKFKMLQAYKDLDKVDK